MADLLPSVVSLRPLKDEGTTELASEKNARRVVVKEIEASFKKFGCVCVPVSDLDQSREGGESGEALLHRCYTTAEGFFSLPEASKQAYTEDEAARRGYGGSCYTPLGKEPAYVEGEKQFVESFSCTRPLDESACSHFPRGHEFHSNLFPDSDVPGFGDAHSALWEALRDRVALPIINALEVMLCLPPGFLLLKSTEVDSLNMSLLRTLRYPARDAQHCPSAVSPETKRRRFLNTPKANPVLIEVGISEHTDFEVVTVMHQESPGLWLRSPGASSSWYQPPFRRDVLTVILGDMIELWTAGWLEATPHKVVSPVPGLEPRRSLVLFQAHDDLVRVHALRATQLNAPQQEASLRTDEDLQETSNLPRLSRNTVRSCRKKNRKGKEVSDRELRQGSFLEWVLLRPEAVLKKHRPTTQGAWVTKNEVRAKATLLKSAVR